MSNSTGNELSFVSIGERAYKYIRQFTIKSLDDALIELITNSIDAYRKTDYAEKQIFVEVRSDTQIRVRDYALGLTSDEMTQCFLQIGDYTASNNSRGFFSRGAKDISAIGNLTFNAIKDNKYSQCQLNTDAYGAIVIADIDVTPDLRSSIGIPDQNNGLEVIIDLLPNYQGINVDALYTDLSKLVVLRDIFSDKNNIVLLRRFNEDMQIIYESPVTYVYPTCNTILDLIYKVPNYPDVTAHFVIYRVDKPIQQPTKETQMEFGFLMKDSTSIYEVNTIDDKYRWNPGITYLYGYLECDAIKQYLIDYDTNGATETNPYPIIDPSRLTGLNKMHPLITNMLSIPTVRVDLILRQMNSDVSSKSVSLTDVDDLMSELTSLGLNLMKEENITVNFTPSYDSNLIQAVQDQRGRYVTSEISQQLSDNYNIEEQELDNYVKDQILNIGNPSGFYYMTDSRDLVQLQNDTNDELNEPIDILRLKQETGKVIINEYPYLYTMTPTGQLMKLYIFQQGLVNKTNPEKNLGVQQKMISIVFINDLNLQTRFLIDRSDGITIKLNINNQMIKKYLANKNIDDLDDMISIATFSSTQSLIFMKELITEILTQLIITNDVENNKIILDSTTVNNAQKLLDYKNVVSTRIETTIDNIFQNYVDSNIQKKLSVLQGTITNIESTVLSMVDYTNPSVVKNLKQMSDMMKTSLVNSVE